MLSCALLARHIVYLTLVQISVASCRITLGVVPPSTVTMCATVHIDRSRALARANDLRITPRVNAVVRTVMHRRDCSLRVLFASCATGGVHTTNRAERRFSFSTASFPLLVPIMDHRLWPLMVVVWMLTSATAAGAELQLRLSACPWALSQALIWIATLSHDRSSRSESTSVLTRVGPRLEVRG